MSEKVIRAKTVEESRAEQVQIIMPPHVNQSFRLFGGKLMEWIDVVAAVVARRHSQREVITAAVEHLEFQAPAHLNDIVVLRGHITYVGRSSMEICVDTFVEHPEENTPPVQVNRAFLTMVAIGDDHRPTEVPRLVLQTDEEREAFAAGERRRAAAKAMKQG
ncbi:MAG: acyl-CoA thioesterase [Eubacteriales bacterium]|nr:acyl-CoA thioesterase [Eubacteriales bacterium]